MSKHAGAGHRGEYDDARRGAAPVGESREMRRDAGGCVFDTVPQLIASV